MDDKLIGRIDAAIGKMADQVKAHPNAQRSVHCSQTASNLANSRLRLTDGVVGKELIDKVESAILKMVDHVLAHNDGQQLVHCSQAASNLTNARSILMGEKPKATRKKT